MRVRLRQKRPTFARPPENPKKPGRNTWHPQVIAPHRVDLILRKPRRDEVAVPASINGRSLIDGRP
ncbi:hypothetical protein BMJ34_27485 [Sinorhizobium medicae]|uniref:Uncharacterized protein n=1 Tax=Sinorhizobium medicae TaxID=110321 RepID=A0A508X257_9HYPH|nr:hypothetical protein BMJ34_27485 [Sinorhizobium medicae]PLU05170.1 hypothetical protein BMJ33_09845 [Sinorhizobium medicae]PLU09893.1 hypothetical protein BMJ30_34135 [Sinorhizobium medicae]PLU24993.1 hypothetical protein BMJ29_02240 [Sinorhizobium medicae]PLU34330.1 hypothetical protein BMJ27_15120 [Sinorhizobium medicae]